MIADYCEISVAGDAINDKFPNERFCKLYSDRITLDKREETKGHAADHQADLF